MSIKSLLSFVAGAAAGAAATYFLTSEQTAEARTMLKEKAANGLEPVKQKVIKGLGKAEKALENL